MFDLFVFNCLNSIIVNKSNTFFDLKFFKWEVGILWYIWGIIFMIINITTLPIWFGHKTLLLHVKGFILYLLIGLAFFYFNLTLLLERLEFFKFRQFFYKFLTIIIEDNMVESRNGHYFSLRGNRADWYFIFGRLSGYSIESE